MERNNMENNSESRQEDGFVFFLLHAVIVIIICVLLTLWLKGNKQGGADIARWGFQGVLFLIQLFGIMVTHKGERQNFAFFGCIITFIPVFIYEVKDTSGW